MTKPRNLFAVGFCAVLVAPPAVGQVNDAFPFVLECTFSASVTANISTKFGIQVKNDSETIMDFKFLLASESEARMVGDRGDAKVVPVWGINRVTFVETTSTGTMQTTTMYGIGRGKKAAVHSRSSGNEGLEIPSQWYGFCEAQ
ncbi:hypothetical protein SAMN05444004_10228 [Jannaschia faecimaris]|uniref:Uncharacterized protein n=1 Tax=Jannaschia faecimaris TaxID=1244108 RepID=A0A1H3KY61_9RHOB|nr:hypothetical protein [Jannaschia faecimaris]SDY57167.1 hypothetical protein SAMN05444004_10228 [Jannaschia faecimaris]